MTFNKFIQLCNFHHNPVLEYFYQPKHSLKSICSQSPLQLPTQGKHEFISLVLSFLEISYKWNNSTLVLRIWLHSLSTFLRFIHVITCISYSFIKKNYWAVFQPYHILSTALFSCSTVFEIHLLFFMTQPWNQPFLHVALVLLI